MFRKKHRSRNLISVGVNGKGGEAMSLNIQQVASVDGIFGGGVSGYSFLIVGVILLYAVVARGLFLLTDPVRHSLLDLAETLQEDTSFPESERRLVELALDHVYSTKYAWRMAFEVIGLSFGMLLGLVKRTQSASTGSSYRDTYASFRYRWIVSVLGNSVIATVVFVLFLVILSSFATSVGFISRVLIHSGNGEDNGGTAVLP